MATNALTRIKNNQIFDSTIYANAKIVPGSIVGSLFNANLTMTSDVTITGNLTVQGASTYLTVASTNTYVNDPLIVLNNAFSGTNTYDLGFVFNRGSLQNTALIWNEFNKEFRLVGTTETGTTYGNINQSNFANLRIGNLTVQYAMSISTITASSMNVTGNVIASTVLAQLLTADDLTVGNVAAGFIGNTGTQFSGASINLSGNVLASTVLAQLVTSDDATFGNIASGFIGNTGTQFSGASINLSGNVLASSILASYTSATSAVFGNVASGFIGNAGTAFTGASLNVSGNVLASTINSTTENTSTVNAGAINAVTIGNAGATVQGTTAQFTGNVIGGLAQFAAINATPIGNATASTGAFTTLSASGTIWANASAATTTQGTGAIVIPNGGISVAGAANIGTALYVTTTAQINSTLGVGGAVSFTNTTNATGVGSGGALTVAGGASFGQDVYIGGNLYAANIIGVTANVITVQDPLLYLRPNVVYPYNYDIGIYSAFTGAGLSTLANVYQHTGIIRDYHNNAWTFASNLAEPGGGIVAFDSTTVYDPIIAGNLALQTSIPATNNATGALIVVGGAGIGGSLYARDIQATVIGNTTPASAFFTTVNATGNVLLGLTQASAINATPIGNASASTGAFTTLSASAGIWANSTTASTNTTTGALVLAGGLGLAGNIFQGGAYHDTSSSNFIFATTPTTVDAFKAATTLNVGANSGTLTIGNPTIAVTQSTITLANTTATTVNAFGAATALNFGAAVGSTTVRNGIYANAAISSESFDSGAIVVPNGGIGTNGNIHIHSGYILHVGPDVADVTRSGTLAQFNADADQRRMVLIRNRNSGTSATSSFLAGADNIGNDGTFNRPSTNIFEVGITSSTYANTAATVFGPNDGFVTINGNNLVINTQTTNKVIKFATGGVLNSALRGKFTDYGLSVNTTTQSTNITTGALVVNGGVGIAGNLWLGNGAVINSTQTSDNFVIRTTSSTAGLIYNTGKQQLILNGGDFVSNTTPVGGATLAIRATDSMLIPVGTTAQRPSNSGNIDLQGMLRFNTSATNLEYYDGSAWKTPGAGLQVITDQNFNGDGSANTFVLSNTSTTNSTIVSINGVLQIPVLAYSITGNVLTFTEAPASGDLIDVRALSTTAVVSALASPNGFVSFDVQNPTSTYANIIAGSSAATVRVALATDGTMNLINDTKIAVNGSAYNIAANNTPYTIDTYTQTLYSTAEYKVTAKRGTGAGANIESYSATVITDGAGNAFVSVYGVINNGYTMGQLSANVLGGNVQLYYTGINAAAVVQANVKIYATYIV